MRIVDIDPFIQILDKEIRDFKRNNNALGAGIYTMFKKAILALPVIKR